MTNYPRISSMSEIVHESPAVKIVTQSDWTLARHTTDTNFQTVHHVNTHPAYLVASPVGCSTI